MCSILFIPFEKITILFRQFYLVSPLYTSQDIVESMERLKTSKKGRGRTIRRRASCSFKISTGWQGQRFWRAGGGRESERKKRDGEKFAEKGAGGTFNKDRTNDCPLSACCVCARVCVVYCNTHLFLSLTSSLSPTLSLSLPLTFSLFILLLLLSLSLSLLLSPSLFSSLSPLFLSPSFSSSLSLSLSLSISVSFSSSHSLSLSLSPLCPILTAGRMIQLPSPKIHANSPPEPFKKTVIAGRYRPWRFVPCPGHPGKKKRPREIERERESERKRKRQR